LVTHNKGFLTIGSERPSNLKMRGRWIKRRGQQQSAKMDDEGRSEAQLCDD